MDRCININNGKVKEIAKALNLPPALAAVKIEVWMDKNGDKIPTAQDLMPTEIDFALEKQVSENTANNQIEELTAKYPDYTFSKQKDTRLRGFNSWSVYANKKETKTPTGQLPLFAAEESVVKPGVSELFESNPELANSVYEALGFKNNSKEKYEKLEALTYDNFLKLPKNEIEDILVYHLSTFPSNLPSVGKPLLLGAGYSEIPSNFYPELKFNKIFIKYEDGQFNLYKNRVDNSGITKPKNENNLTKEEGDKILSEKLLGYNRFNREWKLHKEDISSEDLSKFIQYSGKLEKETYSEEDYKKAFDWWYNNEKNRLDNPKITVKRREQAQQAYSNYLDTIFPDSKVKDIVYHGTEKSFEQFSKDAEKVTIADQGIFFAPTKNQARNSGKVIVKAIINSNPLISDNRIERISEKKKQELLSQGYNGYVYSYNKTISSADDIVVFEPEQIHQLGGKQDIQGFKEFVNKPLFAGDINARPNVIEVLENRGTMSNNKFKTFLGSNISDSQTALKKIAASTSAMSNIAKKLLRSNLNVPIEVIDVDYFTNDNMPEGVVFGKEEGFKAGGFYYSGKVYIARGANRAAISLLLHEILHAYTKNYLANNPDSSAVKNFDRLLKHLRSPEINKLIADKYPLSDLDELLAGIFTNRDFIEDLKLIPATNKNFKSVWDEILQIFKVVFGVQNVSLLDEVFAEAANIVELSMDEYESGREKSELFNKVTPVFSQEAPNNTGIQKIISNRLDELGAKAKNVNGDYVVQGYDINWKRPSSIAKAIIGSFTSGIKSDAQIEREKLYQESGTILHAIQASIIKKNFPEYNQAVPEFVATPELQPFEEVIEAQLQPIIDAAKSRGSIMKAEVFLGNVKSSKAGTADLLEITPEGKYYTYDLKTRFTSDTTGVSRFNKVYEWSLQTSEYNKMLESGDPELGIVKGKVLGTYIIEFVLEPKRSNIKFSGNVQFKSTTPEKFLSNRQLKSFNIVAPTFLRTEDTKLNEMISKLLKQTEELKKFRGGTEIQREAKNQVLLSKLQLLQDLQLKQDITKLLDAASFELSYIKELIDSGNIQEEQQFIKEQLALYSNLRSYFTGASDELRTKMYKVQDLALDLNDKFLQMGKEAIVEAANSTGVTGFVKDVFAAVKDISWMRKMVTGISTVDNPLVATAYRTVTTALARSREKIEVMANKLKEANDELYKYLGKVDYSMMIDGDELVQQFTKDFYKTKKIAEKAGDVSWFDANVDYNEAKYLEARDRQLNYQETFGKKAYANYLKLEDSTLTADEIDLRADKEVVKRMVEWDSANKKNKTKYFTPKNQWLNPKWVEIKQGNYKGTAVEKFYDIYLANLEVANSIAPNKNFTKGFIANFSKNFIEKTAQNGLLGAIKGNASGLLDELSPGFDEAYGQRDIITGESVRSLYIPGTSDAKQDKSLDLASSMYKFMEGVYRYEELKDIEKVVLAVKQELKSAKFLQTDKLGNLVNNGVTEGTVIQNSNTYQMFEAWSDAIFYGQYKKGDTAFKISGNGFGKLLGLKKDEEKAISVGKIIDGFIKYTSIRNLGFNMYSPITNLFGGASNQYMTGASGAYYSGTDLTKAYSLVLGGKLNFPNEEIKKARLILDWLQIDTGEFSKDISEKLSAYKANKLLSDWNSMTLMRESENVLREAGAIAMILSGKNGVTMEDFDLVDGKLNTKLNIYKKETLRQKVIAVNNKNIGGINNDDIMMAKTYITGRLLMQHRSWLPALFYSRFGQKQKNYVLEQDIEGRYVTAYRLFKYYFDKSKFTTLEDFEKANMKETATEAALILATGVLSLLLKAGLDDDDKEEAYYKITTKINSRFLSELTFFVDPTLQSQYQILLKPAAAAGTVEDLGRFVGSLYKESMGDEKEKKKNKPLKKALKLIPGANKVESFLNDLGYTE